MIYLDFEKPIAELEAKLTDMKQLADTSDESVNKAIRTLEQKIVELNNVATLYPSLDGYFF